MRISDWSSDVCSSDLAAASLLRTARNGHSIHGFAVLYATDVRPPLLYGPNMSPLRVTGTIGTESDIEGPYLAPVAFEGEPDGRAAAIEAYAAPIFHARRFTIGEHTSELQSLMRISYAVFCLKKTKTSTTTTMNRN